MSQKLEILYNKKFCYDIIIEQNFLKLSEELKKIGCENKKIGIVTDSNVESIYKDEIFKLLQEECHCDTYVFKFCAGEEHKNLNTVNEIYHFLIENGFERKDMLLALGAL